MYSMVNMQENHSMAICKLSSLAICVLAWNSLLKELFKNGENSSDQQIPHRLRWRHQVQSELFSVVMEPKMLYMEVTLYSPLQESLNSSLEESQVLE